MDPCQRRSSYEDHAVTDEPLPAPSLVQRSLAFARRWRNTTYSAFDHLWLLLLWAISTPIFIAKLGEDLFGVWILINALIGLNGVISFGFGEATVRYVAYYHAKAREDTVRSVVETSATMYVGISSLFALGIWLGSPRIAEAIFHVSGPAAAPSITGLHLAAVAQVVMAFLKTFEAAINGYERFDITARMSIVTRSFIILSNVALVLSGFGLTELLLITVVGLGGQAVALYVFARRKFIPDLRPYGWGGTEVSGVIIRFGVQNWLQIFAGALSNIADRFLVGALIGPAAAGVYSICIQLAQQIHLLLYRGLAWLMPASSRGTANEAGSSSLESGYRTGAFLTLLVVAAIATPIYVLAPQVLTVWIDEKYARLGSDVLRMLLIYFSIWSLSVPGFFLINGTGHPAWNTVASILHGALVLSFAALLLPRYGLDGISWARLVALPSLAVTFYALHVKVLHGRAWHHSIFLIAGLTIILVIIWSLEKTLGEFVPARLIPLVGSAIALGFTASSLVSLAIWGYRRSMDPPSDR